MIYQEFTATRITTCHGRRGINDAATLAQADIGLAMASGSDIAIESAVITLMNSDPITHLKAINLSRLAVKVIK